MANIEELGPLQQQLIRLYAKRYGMSEEQFLAELDKMEGETLTDKLRNYANIRRGISATGNLLTVYKEKPYPREDGTMRYRVGVMVFLPEDERNRLAQALGLSEDQKAILQTPVFSVWYSDKKLVDRLHNTPVGSKLLITGIQVSYGDRGGVFLNARNIVPQGVDYEFLDANSATPADLKDVALDDGGNIILKIFGANVIPDPVETTTSKGLPKVRVYIDDAIQLDFLGTAVTKLKQFGDPYSAEFWAQFKDKPMYVRAIYQRNVGDLMYFTCVDRSDIVV